MNVKDSVEFDSQLLLLIEASSVLLASPEPGDILRNLLSLGQQFIKADAYAVWRRQEDGTRWEMVAGSGLSEACRATISDSERKGGPLQAKPIAIEDIAASELVDYRSSQYEAEGIRSLLIVPIPIRGVEAGTIVFYYRARHQFSPSEMKIGAALGNLAAATLTTSELYEQQRQLREEAECSAQRSKFLAEAGEVIASSLDYQETLKSVADRAVPFFADWCAVDVIDGAELTRVAIKHLNPAKIDLSREISERYPPGEDSAIWVAIRTGQSFLVEEIPDELIAATATGEEHAALLRKLGLKSLIIAPLVTRGQSLGCLTFASAESGQRYRKADLALAEEIARRAAVAIDNARLHKQVLANERQWQTLANSIPPMAWMADEKGWLFWYNHRWYEYTGTTFEEMQGWGWKKVVHPDHAERVAERISRAWDSGEPWEDVFPVRSKEGEWRWFLSRVLPIRDESGRVVRWFGTNTDVTEQRSAREAAETSKTALARRVAEFETLLEVTPIGLVVAYDRECRQMRVNRAFAEWVGTSVDDNISRTGPNVDQLPYKVFKDGQQLEGRDLPMQTAAREGKEVATEVDIVRNDGRTVSIFGYATPLFDEQGIPRGSVGAFVDVTERRRTQQELQRTNEELKRANSDLEQFAYSASHDLREPLRNVAIYSQMITRKYAAKLDEQGHQFLGYVIDGARRMDALVSDLLAFTRAGGIDEEAEHERTSAHEALQTTLSSLSNAVTEAQAEITHGALPDVSVRRVHLEQLFQNLIGNSIKYHSDEAPRIQVSAERRGDRWLWSVKDNGIGIDPEYKERIFGIFKRLHRQEEYPGTGMGLAICQRIVERYHGRIWVESEYGRGATFYFTLPA